MVHGMQLDNVAASGADSRSIVLHRTVAADPRGVWEGWASAEGIVSWLDPPGCNLDLRVGGPFEIYFDMTLEPGSRGSEGCVYLGYVPGEMISFTWNAPPHLPLRAANTWVVITFTPDAIGTAVRLVHTGFLEGADWDDYMAYFEIAWPNVLDLLVQHWT